MSSASFEAVNYAVRPNKNVERKLIAECLQGLVRRFDMQTYRYIGFGSMWFVDFILFHKLLLMEDMVSIERDSADRADFNKPFGCIAVEEGESTTVLPTLKLDSKRAVVWLDYNSHLTGPIFEDIRIVCRSVPSGSIVMFTVNGNRRQIDDETLVQKATLEDKDAARLAVLEKTAGDFLPNPMPAKPFSLQAFPGLVADILLAAIQHAVLTEGRPGKDDRFYPIFNFAYSDAAQMVTVGGMIASGTDRKLLDECELPVRCEYAKGTQQVLIDVPPLTLREKWAIDGLLPSDPSPSSEDLKNKFNFVIKDAQLEEYCRYYRFYPVFSEFHG